MTTTAITTTRQDEHQQQFPQQFPQQQQQQQQQQNIDYLLVGNSSSKDNDNDDDSSSSSSRIVTNNVLEAIKNKHDMTLTSTLTLTSTCKSTNTNDDNCHNNDENENVHEHDKVDCNYNYNYNSDSDSDDTTDVSFLSKSYITCIATPAKSTTIRTTSTNNDVPVGCSLKSTSTNTNMNTNTNINTNKQQQQKEQQDEKKNKSIDSNINNNTTSIINTSIKNDTTSSSSKLLLSSIDTVSMSLLHEKACNTAQQIVKDTISMFQDDFQQFFTNNNNTNNSNSNSNSNSNCNCNCNCNNLLNDKSTSLEQEQEQEQTTAKADLQFDSILQWDVTCSSTGSTTFGNTTTKKKRKNKNSSNSKTYNKALPCYIMTDCTKYPCSITTNKHMMQRLQNRNCVVIRYIGNRHNQVYNCHVINLSNLIPYNHNTTTTVTTSNDSNDNVLSSSTETPSTSTLTSIPTTTTTATATTSTTTQTWSPDLIKAYKNTISNQLYYNQNDDNIDDDDNNCNNESNNDVTNNVNVNIHYSDSNIKNQKSTTRTTSSNNIDNDNVKKKQLKLLVEEYWLQYFLQSLQGKYVNSYNNNENTSKHQKQQEQETQESCIDDDDDALTTTITNDENDSYKNTNNNNNNNNNNRTELLSNVITIQSNDNEQKQLLQVQESINKTTMGTETSPKRRRVLRSINNNNSNKSNKHSTNEIRVLRAGDVIQYHAPNVIVSNHSLRIGTILNCYPNNKKEDGIAIETHLNDYIQFDDQVRLLQRYLHDKVQPKLNQKFHTINDYYILKSEYNGHTFSHVTCTKYDCIQQFVNDTNQQIQQALQNDNQNSNNDDNNKNKNNVCKKESEAAFNKSQRSVDHDEERVEIDGKDDKKLHAVQQSHITKSSSQSRINANTNTNTNEPMSPLLSPISKKRKLDSRSNMEVQPSTTATKRRGRPSKQQQTEKSNTEDITFTNIIGGDTTKRRGRAPKKQVEQQQPQHKQNITKDVSSSKMFTTSIMLQKDEQQQQQQQQQQQTQPMWLRHLQKILNGINSELNQQQKVNKRRFDYKKYTIRKDAIEMAIKLRYHLDTVSTIDYSIDEKVEEISTVLDISIDRLWYYLTGDPKNFISLHVLEEMTHQIDIWMPQII